MAIDIESGLIILVAYLFALAAAHKLRVVNGGKAAEEPLIEISRFRQRFATPLLALVAGGEFVLSAALLIVPTVAAIVSALVLTAYAVDLRRLQPTTSCRCFGEALGGGATVRSAQRRNIVLAVLTLAFAVSTATHRFAPSYADGAGVALIVIACVSGFRLGGFSQSRNEVSG